MSKKLLSPLGEQTIVFVFLQSIIIVFVEHHYRLYVRNIYSIFPVYGIKYFGEIY